MTNTEIILTIVAVEYLLLVGIAAYFVARFLGLRVPELRSVKFRILVIAILVWGGLMEVGFIHSLT